MATKQDQELIGVECGKCHKEAFRLVPRMALVELKVCPRCAAEIDLGDEEKMIQDVAKAVEKAERRLFFKEKSYEWANKLHGKKVIVFWDRDTHPVFCSPKSKYSVRGTAFQTSNAAGGWGQVKVILDSSENKRIMIGCHYTLYCERVKCDMFHAPASVICDNTECEERSPIIDGQRFGLFLNRDEDGSYYAIYSWGYRKAIQLDEDIC